MNHGVYVSQLATSVSTPVVAESGIPFVVGLAPVQVADKPASNLESQRLANSQISNLFAVVEH